MSAKERERLKVFARVKRGELQQKEAALTTALELEAGMLPIRRWYEL